MTFLFPHITASYPFLSTIITTTGDLFADSTTSVHSPNLPSSFHLHCFPSSYPICCPQRAAAPACPLVTANSTAVILPLPDHTLHGRPTPLAELLSPCLPKPSHRYLSRVCFGATTAVSRSPNQSQPDRDSLVPISFVCQTMR